jgi:hypothetical protein
MYSLQGPRHKEKSYKSLLSQMLILTLNRGLSLRVTVFNPFTKNLLHLSKERETTSKIILFLWHQKDQQPMMKTPNLVPQIFTNYRHINLLSTHSEY